LGLKFFDLFAGIGGFRLGMERAGHTCVGSCEWDKYARETYKYNFNQYPEYDDAKDMHAQSLPSFDVLCAGFPCQAFSIAGKRLGFEDPRGNIFFEIARIAKAKRPSYLFLENVKGLLSHEKGDTFRTIISTLDEMGYDAEWQVLNSKYFVPQNRERVFIIGHLRGERTRQIFPLGDFNSESDKPKPKIVGVVNDKGNLREVEQATCLDANYWKGCDNHAQRTMIYLSNTKC
jgi:DNA (cytosine-5)-methyltransferase 1